MGWAWEEFIFKTKRSDFFSIKLTKEKGSAIKVTCYCNYSYLLNRDIEQLSVRELGHSKKAAKSNTDEMDARIRDTGNDSASTAPRSTEESLSEDVFTESELSPIREELVSSDELRQGKSSGASSESVQTINQTSAECLTIISDSKEADSDLKLSAEMVVNVKQFSTHSLGSESAEMAVKGGQESSENTGNVLQQSRQDAHGSKEQNKETKMDQDKDSTQAKEPEIQSKTEESPHCEDTTDSPKKETTSKGKVVKERTQDSETEVEELRKLWKTHTMQQTKQQRENMQQDSQKEISQKTVAAGEGQPEGESVFMDGVSLQTCNAFPFSSREFSVFCSAEHIVMYCLFLTVLKIYLSYTYLNQWENFAQEIENVNTFVTDIFLH